MERSERRRRRDAGANSHSCGNRQITKYGVHYSLQVTYTAVKRVGGPWAGTLCALFALTRVTHYLQLQSELGQLGRLPSTGVGDPPVKMSVAVSDLHLCDDRLKIGKHKYPQYMYDTQYEGMKGKYGSWLR